MELAHIYYCDGTDEFEILTNIEEVETKEKFEIENFGRMRTPTDRSNGNVTIL